MYIDIHTHKPFFQLETTELVNAMAHENIALKNRAIYSLGLHPWFVGSCDAENALAKIESNISRKNLLAIGECGLDKRRGPELKTQQYYFMKQAEISERSGKPLIIHCVKAFSELMQFHKIIRPRQAWIIHGFQGKKTLSEQLLAKGFFLSFGEALISSGTLQEAFRSIPNGSFFLETDESESAIEDIYKTAAKIKEQPIDELKRIINKNFENIFKQQ